MVADVLVFVALACFAFGFFQIGYMVGKSRWRPPASITNITAARGFPRSRKPHK